MKILSRLIAPAFLMLLTLSGCKTVEQTTTGTLVRSEMEKVVSGFCSCMVQQCSDPDYVQYLAPSFAEKQKIRYADYEINNYSPKTFDIDSSNPSTGVVITRVHGADHGWTHRITWKVVVENGKHYILPGGINESSKEFIDPWTKVDSYIK